MYLLTLPYTLEDYDAVTLSGVSSSDVGAVIDTDLTTYVDTATLAPVFTVDFGAGRSKVVDAIFIKGENLNNYTLYGSNTSVTDTSNQLGVAMAVPSHGNAFQTFSNTQKYRYFRLSFSARGSNDPHARIHEIFLMRLLLDLNTDEKRPLHYRPSIPRDGVVAYETYNKNLVQYNTEGEEKTTLTFQWEHLDNDVADALEALWQGPPHAPELTIYPRPNAEPDKIYIAKWNPEFGFKFTGPFSALGKSGQVVFEEI